jgi:DNA replication protein DnaC
MRGLIDRYLADTVKRRLQNNPAVAILGPRQCGKMLSEPFWNGISACSGSACRPPALAASIKQDGGPHRFVDRLLECELVWREQRSVRTSLKLSGLPTGQTLVNFDFSFQPSIERSRIETLATAILDRLLHHSHVFNIKGRS